MIIYSPFPIRSGGFYFPPQFFIGIFQIVRYGLSALVLIVPLLIMIVSLHVYADEDEYVYESTVHGHKINSTDELANCAETIDVSDKTSTVESVAGVLSNAQGVQIRQLGGLGSYGSASIRGSTSLQVPVYLDGILLNSGGFSSINLGDLNLDILDSIEIYRGSTPVLLGMGGIGGALLLKTRSFDDAASEIALSYGSWNTGRIMALNGSKLGKTDALIIFSAQGSYGDFKYLNRNGTPRTETDDITQERQNNKHVSYSGLFKLKGKLGLWKWNLLNDLFTKRMGLAGIDSVPTESSELRIFRDVFDFNVGRILTDRAQIKFGAGYLIHTQDFDDPENEIGIGIDHSYSKSQTINLSSVFNLDFSNKHKTALRLESLLDHFLREDLLLNEKSSPSKRLRLGLGLEHTWSPASIIKFVPAFRFQWHRSRFAGYSKFHSFENDSRSNDDLFWSPSLGIRWEILSGIILRSNVGRYMRSPDLLELFGDSGAVSGNPKLKPETGINADAGFTVVLENKGILSLLRFDAAWFGSWAKDLIAYVQNSQNTVRPENVDSAIITGVETGLRFLLGNLFSFTANYTYLYGINRSEKPYHNGKRLPGRPVHEAYGKVEVGKTGKKWGGASWVDVDYAGRNFLDQANLREDALARLLFGAGAKIEKPDLGLTLTLEIKNLFNKITLRDKDGFLRPLRDYDAFPLPGRTFFVTLDWKI